MDPYTRRVALVALLYSTAATAHEHHMNKIKEGDAISEDPIVRRDEEC
jgi:hypothetical protein